MIYRIRAGVSIRENDQGGFLLASRPLRTVRLNPSLLALVRRMTPEGMSPSSEAEAKALEALAKKGFLEKDSPAERDAATLPSVSIVIPVKDRAGELEKCLLSLARLKYPEDRLEVIVVDDGSSDGSPGVAREHGALLVTSGGVGRGPAAARNCGSALASGEILAFIDSDCTASPEWLTELIGAFDDEQVSAVGGWVDGLHSASPLDRYEAVMSSLNLGGRERSGDAGEDTFYLPSCNLLVRRSAFASLGGFRPDLHVGEDVDLTWRMRDAGGRIVYLPRGRVWHEHRSRLKAFMKRRFEYGTSEGMLQNLHPLRQKRMVFPPVLALIVALLATAVVLRSGLPLAASAALLLTDAVLAHRRVARQGIPLSYLEILLARGRAAASLAYYAGYHLLRYYLLPLSLIVAIFPSLWVPAAAVVLWVGGVDYTVRRPRLLVPFFLFYYLLEQLAYGGGAFWGCVRQGSFASYRMRISQALA
jgi:mycofactocin system glycosyltransferase